MDSIRILSMERKDCEQVADVAGNNLPEKLTLETLMDVLKYEYNHFYIAYDTNMDMVIGFAGMMVIVDEAELLYIAVDSPYRNKGIGQLLLNQVEEKARQSCANRILLEVRNSNKAAQHFYEKNDFTLMTKRRAYYSNPTEDALIMEKRL